LSGYCGLASASLGVLLAHVSGRSGPATPRHRGSCSRQRGQPPRRRPRRRGCRGARDDQAAGSADRRVVRERGAPRPGRASTPVAQQGAHRIVVAASEGHHAIGTSPAGAIGRARRRCGAHKPASSCTANIRLRRVYSQTAGVSLRRVIGGPAATLPARSPGPVLGSGQPGETCSIFGQGHLDWPSTRPSTCCARAIKTTLEAEPVGRWRSTRSISCCFLWRSE
jgi:hypothetical protein